MPQVSRSTLVPYSVKQMFHLVNDVASYHQFLPGCAAAEVLERTDNSMIASIYFAQVGVKQHFTTRNTWTDMHSIKMALVEGPFRKLSGAWSFIELDDRACQIEFELEFEFASVLVEKAVGKIFKTLTSNMVNAFTKRAKEVYK